MSSFSDGEQSQRFDQTLSLFSEHQNEFSEHNTIFHTIRARYDPSLRAKSQPDTSPSPAQPDQRFTPPEFPYQSALIEPPNSSTASDRESGHELEDDSMYDYDQLDELADLISDAKIDLDQATRLLDHGSVGASHSVNEAASPSSEPTGPVNDPAHDPSTLPTIYPDKTPPKTPSLQEQQGREKVHSLRNALGLYPHSLKLSLSDQPETVSSEAPDFALTSVLGEGGMGTVYEMLQTSLQRSVAMKVAKTSQWNINQLAQHCHEAQVSGYLSHSHIPPIHLLAHDIEGTPLIIMKKIEGVTWGELIKDPQHDFWDELEIETEQIDFHLDILERIAQTLAFAHEKGIIHRDLKPANVMVGQYGDVYLLDWGIAIHLETATQEDTDTIFKAQRFSDLHKQIVGSPAYMPPEMAMGDFHQQGPMTDVYFLGANLFFLLTQQPVHQGETLEKLLNNILTGQLTPIPDSLTPEMKHLLSTSLAMNPEERVSCATEFIRLLKVARTAQKSRELEKRGLEALESLKKLVAHNLMILSEKVNTCVESNFQRYLEMLEKYELAHRSFWAAYQIYPDNTQAFNGFVETLTVWLRRFLHLGEVQAAKAIFEGIPNPSPELKAEVDSAWIAYLQDQLGWQVTEPVAQNEAPPSVDQASASIISDHHSSTPRRMYGVIGSVIALIIALLGFWLSHDSASSVNHHAPALGPQEVTRSQHGVTSVAQAPRSERHVSKDINTQTPKPSRVSVKSTSHQKQKHAISQQPAVSLRSTRQRAIPVKDAAPQRSRTVNPSRVDAQPKAQPRVIPIKRSPTIALPKEVYSFQIAATRNKRGALKHIDYLRKTVDLDQGNPAHAFWLKTVKIKPGKTVHRIMLGRFATREQAKSLTKTVRTIMKRPIIKKVKR